jgi:hypothetical protein
MLIVSRLPGTYGLLRAGTKAGIIPRVVRPSPLA